LKNGRLFASSALWPNLGQKCLQTSAQPISIVWFDLNQLYLLHFIIYYLFLLEFVGFSLC